MYSLTPISRKWTTSSSVKCVTKRKRKVPRLKYRYEFYACF